MVEVIPSINVPTFEEIKERIARVEPYVSWCHLDVTDGVFSKHITWHNPTDLVALDTTLNVEVHLMIMKPEQEIDRWLVKPVKRLIVHLEASKNIALIIKKCREAGVQIGLAINPDTFWGKIEHWYDEVDLIQILAVYPGPSGQKMSEETFAKIAHVRKFCRQCIIEVDGGVNQETAKKAIAAGANILVAGSAIFNAPDMKEAIENLKIQ